MRSNSFGRNKRLVAKKPLAAKTTLKKTKPIAKKAKTHTVAWYKAEAQKQFNRMVKYRDSEWNPAMRQWVFNCITCGSRVLFSYIDEEGKQWFKINAQAGHFMPEGAYAATRYHEYNVNGQCGIRCNHIGLGEQVKYARAIDLKYGEGVAAELERLAHVPKQWTIPELQEIIRSSKEEIAWYESRVAEPV